MKLQRHNLAMQWILRRRTNEVKGKANPLYNEFKKYQSALSDGFEGTMNEYMMGQQVKDGGRIEMKPGGIVEPGVMYYGRKGPLTYSRLPEGFTQEQINIARAEIKRRAKIRGLPKPDFITFPGRGYKKDTPGYTMAKDINQHVRHGDLSTLGKGKGVLGPEVGAAQARKVVEKSGQIKVFNMLR